MERRWDVRPLQEFGFGALSIGRAAYSSVRLAYGGTMWLPGAANAERSGFDEMAELWPSAQGRRWLCRAAGEMWL